MWCVVCGVQAGPMVPFRQDLAKMAVPSRNDIGLLVFSLGYKGKVYGDQHQRIGKFATPKNARKATEALPLVVAFLFDWLFDPDTRPESLPNMEERFKTQYLTDGQEDHLFIWRTDKRNNRKDEARTTHRLAWRPEFLNVLLQTDDDERFLPRLKPAPMLFFFLLTTAGDVATADAAARYFWRTLCRSKVVEGDGTSFQHKMLELAGLLCEYKGLEGYVAYQVRVHAFLCRLPGRGVCDGLWDGVGCWVSHLVPMIYVAGWCGLMESGGPQGPQQGQ